MACNPEPTDYTPIRYSGQGLLYPCLGIYSAITIKIMTAYSCQLYFTMCPNRTSMYFMEVQRMFILLTQLSIKCRLYQQIPGDALTF